jgi:hypothetical protein
MEAPVLATNHPMCARREEFRRPVVVMAVAGNAVMHVRDAMVVVVVCARMMVVLLMVVVMVLPLIMVMAPAAAPRILRLHAEPPDRLHLARRKQKGGSAFRRRRPFALFSPKEVAQEHE